MEQQQNQQVVDKEIDGMMEGMKAQITESVMEQLANKGVEVVPMDYSAGANIVKLVDDYKSKIEEIDKKIEYNEKTYKDCKVMNCELRLDKNDLKRETLEKLDDTLAKQEMVHNQEIEKIRNSQEYKDNRAENLQLLSMLKGCDVPTEQMLDLIGDMCKAEDMKVLGVVKTMFGDNAKASFTIDKAIDGIEQARANSQLKMMIDTMKRFVEDGNENLRVFSYFKQYRK